ncbi:MAG: inositol monophosphatase [Sulfitobacter sp.]|nr:inositol monophosphatase [Sulfitobacter sp.]
MPQTLPAAPTPAVTKAQQAHLLNIVRRAARSEILPRFRRLAAGDISAKSRPDDLVTEADIQAEAMMTRALLIAFPSALVVGEEACSRDPSLVERIGEAPLAFILDPVDGTWNFAHGLAVFGVILAVTRFGRPEFGLIYDPIADDWAIAEAGEPARMERSGGAPRTLKAAMGKPVEALAGHVPLGLFEGKARRDLAALLPTFRRTEALRCSAHEYRMVAQGYTDFVLTQSLNPWDHAAGALICERAGAHVEMLDGGPYTAARTTGHLLVAPDRTTWNRLEKIFRVLLEPDT